MFFLPKYFVYKLDCSPDVVLGKIQSRIKPRDVKRGLADVYDFKGFVTSNSFEVELNPTYSPSIRKDFILARFCGEFRENDKGTTMVVKIKSPKGFYLFLLLFTLLSSSIGFFENDFLMPIFVMLFIYFMLVISMRLTIRDTKERLEDVLFECGCDL